MLSLTIHKLDETIIFQCIGRIVLGEDDSLRRAIYGHPDMSTAVLDLAEVTSMDAAGLGLLVELCNWAQANGTELKLLNVTPRVEHLLEITCLGRIFKVCSVPEMLDLLCRAIHRSSPGTEYAAAS
jgi:anti-sigma B factor antagonist